MPRIRPALPASAVAVAIALAAVAPATSSARTPNDSARAHTADGAITCRAVNPGLDYWTVTCAVKRGHYAVTMDSGGRAERTAFRRYPDRGRELVGGRTSGLGPFRCRYARRTLTCVVNAEKERAPYPGFRITRRGWHTIG